MHALRNFKISIRLQAQIVLFLTTFWFLAAWIAWYNDGDLNAFWAASLNFLPFVISVFTLILIMSYREAERTYRRWVCAAVLAAVICWILILCFIWELHRHVSSM